MRGGRRRGQQPAGRPERAPTCLGRRRRRSTRPTTSSTPAASSTSPRSWPRRLRPRAGLRPACAASATRRSTVLDTAEAEGITTAAAADRLAEERMAAARPRAPDPDVHRGRTMTAVERHPETAPLPLPAEELLGIHRTLVLAAGARPADLRPGRSRAAASVVSCRDREGATDRLGVGGAGRIRRRARPVVGHRCRATLGMTPRDVLLGVLARADDPSSGGRQLPAALELGGAQHRERVSLPGRTSPTPRVLRLASQLRGEDRVAVCYLDDDAIARAGLPRDAGVRRQPVGCRSCTCRERVRSRPSLPPPPGVSQVLVDGALVLRRAQCRPGGSGAGPQRTVGPR